MPNPNWPDPDKIPDMELGERTEPQYPPQPVPEPTTFYKPKPEETAPTPPPAPVPTPPSARKKQWREGDRVLAPWEPMFLYAGTITRITYDEDKGDQALIEFDDGDDGWVFLFSVRPL